MATLTAATAVTRAGMIVSGAFTAASVDDEFANNGSVYLLAANAAVGAKVLTFVTPSNKAPVDNVGALTVENPTVTLAAGETRLIGPFKPSMFNNVNGRVQVTVPDATSVTYKVVSAANYAPTA